MKKMKIADYLIGEEEPCFVVAEAGVNHNGDRELAKKLIDAAKESGADAIKFQTWKTEEIVTHHVSKPKYQKTSKGESQYKMLKKLELSDEDFKQLAEYAKSLGIIFLSTPEGKACTDFIDELGIPAFKIGSADLTNHPHLAYVAQKKKPIMLSTGMATIEEVREAVEVIKGAGNNEIILLHCTSNYPANLENVNLRAMITLKNEFKLPVGYSDHTEGVGVAIVAVLLGAVMIEKHFTLDKNLLGPDHKASLEPREFKKMIDGIRLAETYTTTNEHKVKEKLKKLSANINIENEVINKLEIVLGSSIKKPTNSEKDMIKLVRKYLVAKRLIPKGKRITEDDLGVKRCGGGLEPKYFYDVIGRKTRKKIKKDEVIILNKLI